MKTEPAPPDSPQPDVAIIGGGLAGLAAALRLQHAGARVTLFEKNECTGGKLVEFREDGFRWDMGPSLLTMPQVVDELFEDLGLRRPDYLTFERVDPVCRYFWNDGTILDEDETFLNRPDVAAFLKYAAGIYELSAEAFLLHPPEDFWRAFEPRHWHKLIHLPKITTFKTVSRTVDRFFKDEHVRQLFKRYATYNGSNPYRSPATFNVIPYVETHFGAWYIKGGMARLAKVLTQLARERGIHLHCNSEIIRLDENGLQLRDGTRFQAGTYVVNGDVIRAWRDWIRLPGHRKQAVHLASKELSLSGFVLLLGVNKQYRRLSHHNIFFSRNYETEFRQLFDEHRFPDDPTLYLNVTRASDPADAPEGCDNYFILANAPSRVHGIDWKQESTALSARIIRRLESVGLKDLSQHIVCKRTFSPADFAQRDLSMNGAIYGWASHSPLSSLWRPPLQCRQHPYLFFTGGTTHPGGGIPLVLSSARMVSEKIIRRHKQEQHHAQK